MRKSAFRFIVANFLFVTALYLVVSTRADAQTEVVLRPHKVVSLVQASSDNWNSGLRPLVALADQKRVFVLMLPTRTSIQTRSSLLVFSDDGSLLAEQELSPKIQPTMGIDGAGNVTLFRLDGRNSAAIETHSPDGKLTGESAVVGSLAYLRISELAIKVLRSANVDSSRTASDSRKVEALSQRRFHQHQEYVDLLLSDRNSARFILTRPEFILSDVTGTVIADHVLGRTVLDRYSSVLLQSNDPALTYPQLYCPVISPEGNLFALVGGTKLVNGGIAVKLDPSTGAISSVLRFMLPTSSLDKNPDNVEGFMAPSRMAITAKAIFIIDGTSGLLALYGRF